MLERLVFAITNAALRSRRRELAASPDTVVSELDSEVWRQKIGRIDLMLDSSGRAIFGEGEWAAVKHGGRGVRGWKKLHLGVDSDGVIVGQVLTDANVGGASVGVDLVDRTPGKIRKMIGDGAYDSRAWYDAASSRDAKVVVPSIKTAQTGGRGCRTRGRAVRRIRKVGRRQ
jgi:hypothetical protein